MLLNFIFRCLEILVYFFLAILKTNLFSHHLFICFEEEKIKRAIVLVVTFYRKIRTDNINSLSLTEQENISPC